MAGEIIRLGDKTSHGGDVIEGSHTDICMGKPIAYVGHKTYCPKCRGNFPIVEGVMTTTFYGKGVAIAGMKTSCGATLIASQFTDTVQIGGGGGVAPSSAQALASPIANNSPNGAAATKGKGAGPASTFANDGSTSEGADVVFDEQYLLQDEDGNVLVNMPYTVKLPSGELVHGTTDDEGRTKRYATEQAEELEIYVGHA